MAAVLELAAMPPSLAKLAPTLVSKLLAPMDPRLSLPSVARPEPFVTAEPTPVPFRLKEIVLPLTGDPPEVWVSVADRPALQAYVPVAGATDSVVPVTGAVPVPD